MKRLFQTLGATVLDGIVRLGHGARFAATTLMASGPILRRPGLFVEQVYSLGVLTVLIIVVSGLFVGMVLGLQGYNTLVRFGAEESLGLVVGLTLTREIGPVLGALLFAGRAGSALTAEIGHMKATEQLAALEMMAVNPFMRVFAPRLLAGIFAVPLLAALFDAIGVLGGQLVGVGLLGVDDGSYWSVMKNGVDLMDDIGNGLLKSLVFGAVITSIALFEGYDADPSPIGVSRATNRTVVYSSLAVLGLDYMLTSLMLDSFS